MSRHVHPAAPAAPSLPFARSAQESSRTVTLLAAALALLIAMLAVPAPAAAGVSPDDMCLYLFLLDEEEEVNFVDSIVAGGERAYLVFAVVDAEDEGGSEFCLGLEGLAEIIEVVDVAEEDDLVVQLAVVDADGAYVPNTWFELMFEDGGDRSLFGADNEGDLAIEFFNLGEKDVIFPGGLGGGAGSSVARGIFFSATSEAPAGIYFLFMAIGGYDRATANTGEGIDESNELLPFFFSGFEVLPAPAPAPAAAPAATLSCDTAAPVVGATVTCVLQSDPEVDFLWSASTNPEFATGVVTTDAAGSGTFAFVVPASALGEDVRVEIVEWIAPQSIGVATGPVPTSVPSGGGSAPFALIALATLLALTVMALLARPVTRRVPAGTR